MIIPDLPYRLLAPILPEIHSMVELGNKKNKYGAYKDEFEQMGIDYTSIDWNGQDGALKLNLCEPIYLPSADVVTNFGTSEHNE